MGHFRKAACLAKKWGDLSQIEIPKCMFILGRERQLSNRLSSNDEESSLGMCTGIPFIRPLIGMDKVSIVATDTGPHGVRC
jgi:hypothetical protein